MQPQRPPILPAPGAPSPASCWPRRTDCLWVGWKSDGPTPRIHTDSRATGGEAREALLAELEAALYPPPEGSADA